jgi:hypothetical protein
MLTVLLLASAIMAACVVIHTAGVVTIAEWLLERREAFRYRLSMPQFAVLLIALFAIVVVLHFAEAAIWAAFYYWWGLFGDYETSLYFSLKSYSTIGYGDVVLPKSWRVLGCLEGITGVLLCGLSTAFIFVVINAMIQYRTQRQAGEG